MLSRSVPVNFMMDLQVARSYRSFGMRTLKNVEEERLSAQFSVQFSLKLRIKRKKGIESEYTSPREEIYSIKYCFID